jgi:hypothetical protein
MNKHNMMPSIKLNTRYHLSRFQVCKVADGGPTNKQMWPEHDK